jgi:DNA-binding response OmpR family regulator
MKKILIVSSDSRLLGLLNRELSHRGYRVLTECDPECTFADIEWFAPDLLIVDLILDEYNGGAISHQVKSDPQLHDLLVILLSEYELETYYPSRFGCDLIIQKSDDIGSLIEHISYLIEEKRVSFDY